MPFFLDDFIPAIFSEPRFRTPPIQPIVFSAWVRPARRIEVVLWRQHASNEGAADA